MPQPCPPGFGGRCLARRDSDVISENTKNQVIVAIKKLKELLLCSERSFLDHWVTSVLILLLWYEFVNGSNRDPEKNSTKKKLKEC